MAQKDLVFLLLRERDVRLRRRVIALGDVAPVQTFLVVGAPGLPSRVGVDERVPAVVFGFCFLLVFKIRCIFHVKYTVY